MRKELLYSRTGSTNPSFLSIDYNFEGFEHMDWIGVYSKNTKLCYGCEQVPVGYSRCQQVAFMDEFDTDQIDGFTYGEEIGLFLYDVSEDKFFDLTGTYSKHLGSPVEKLVAMPLAVYQVTNIVKGEEIQLNYDPILSEVVLQFVEETIEINTGQYDKIKLNFIASNVNEISVFKASGNGSVISDNTGLYYKPDPGDTNVIINIVGKDIFTGQMVTDKVTLILDQSVSANAVFEDDNICFYLKNGEMWAKSKAERASVDLKWTYKGVTNRLWRGAVKNGADVRILPYYSNFKGYPASATYWHYLNGKMVVKTGTNISFTL